MKGKKVKKVKKIYERKNIYGGKKREKEIKGKKKKRRRREKRGGKEGCYICLYSILYISKDAVCPPVRPCTKTTREKRGDLGEYLGVLGRSPCVPWASRLSTARECPPEYPRQRCCLGGVAGCCCWLAWGA